MKINIVYNGWTIHQSRPPHPDGSTEPTYWIENRPSEVSKGNHWIDAVFRSLFDAMLYIATNLEMKKYEE